MVFFRSIFMSAIIALTVGEVFVYSRINDYIQAGALPWYTLDVCIIGVALIEVFSAPTSTWLGFGRRGATISSWLITAALAILLILPMEKIELPKGDGLCLDKPGPVISTHSFFILLFVGVCTALARQTICNNGIAYLAEYHRDVLGHHYTIMASARFLSLAILPSVMGSMPAWSVALGVAAALVIAAMRLSSMPEEYLSPMQSDRIHRVGQCFLRSGLRIAYTEFPCYFMIIAGLMASCLWGFGSNRRAIQKTLYMVSGNDNDDISDLSDILLGYCIIIPLIAMKQMPTVQRIFNGAVNSKFAFLINILIGVMYLVMAFGLDCNVGQIAGYDGVNYTQPNCSAKCECVAPYSGFSPVCVTSPAVPPTTYISACHAGCQKIEDSGNATASIIMEPRSFMDCLCGEMANITVWNETAFVSSAHAYPHACNAHVCSMASVVHHVFYLLTVTLTVLSFQLQSVYMMHRTCVLDQSVALTLTGSCSVMFSFVFGHFIYTNIGVKNCAWSENGVCLLHNDNFPRMVGMTSALTAFFAGGIGIYAWNEVNKWEVAMAARLARGEVIRHQHDGRHEPIGAHEPEYPL